MKAHVANTTSQYNLPPNKVNLKNVGARISLSRWGWWLAYELNASLLTSENGFEPGASYDASLLQDTAGSYDLNSPPVKFDYNDMNITYSGDGDRLDEASADDDGTEFNNGNLSENMLE